MAYSSEVRFSIGPREAAEIGLFIKKQALLFALTESNNDVEEEYTRGVSWLSSELISRLFKFSFRVLSRFVCD